MRAGSPSANVAKLLAAFAGHCRTPLHSLDPVVALGALLILGPSDKLNEVCISLVEGVVDLVLGTGHSLMVDTLALEAVVLRTCWASVVVEILLELKDSSAPCGGAPCG